MNTNERQAVVEKAVDIVDSGTLLKTIDRLVSYKTESQEPHQVQAQIDYLTKEIAPALHEMGFNTRIVDNPISATAPLLIGERIEDSSLPTILTYGHADVVRGYDDQWNEGLSPWKVTVVGDRWYGRGIADNKGQHAINLAALQTVLEARKGKLGYNVKVLFESGEEIDSPGLNAVCEIEKEALASDVFIASDGPRVSAERPTLFLGSRGGILFDLEVTLRDSAHHSGNWGGVLSNPATILAHAMASLVDQNGCIQVEALLPPPIPDSVSAALADVVLGQDDDAPEIDHSWGQPGLTAAERVLAWNTIEILAFKCANADSPVNAIQATAKAVCDFRFVVGSDWRNLEKHLRNHLNSRGLDCVQVKVTEGLPATRLDPDDVWAQWAVKSVGLTSGKKPALLPNFGGTTPNYIFAETLGLPTIWIPHSYPACSQHAPNEHFLGSVAREAMAIMAGIWWDLGEDAQQVVSQRNQ